MSKRIKDVKRFTMIDALLLLRQNVDLLSNKYLQNKCEIWGTCSKDLVDFYIRYFVLSYSVDVFSAFFIKDMKMVQ